MATKVTATFGDIGNIVASVPFIQDNPVLTSIKNTVKGVLDYIGLDASTAGVPDEYLVKIKSSKFDSTLPVITAKIQDKISLRIGSEWAPLLPTDSAWTDIANSAMQLLTGKSVIASVQSRRIWKGSSPVVINMNLKFYAVDDVFREVVLPCMKLQQLASPSQLGGKETFQGIPLLAPPGPSPFKSSEAAQNFITNAVGNVNNTAATYVKSKIDNISNALAVGEDITITYGRFLTFNSVIVKDITVEFDNKFTANGYPIGANVSVIFETYEVMTKEGIEEVYAKAGQADSTQKQQSFIDQLKSKFNIGGVSKQEQAATLLKY